MPNTYKGKYTIVDSHDIVIGFNWEMQLLPQLRDGGLYYSTEELDSKCF